MLKKKLAIVSTHPIQYNAPWFRLLSERKEITIKVFYTWSQSAAGLQFDPGFGKEIAWDIPLLEAYDYAFVENVSPDPGTRKYGGIVNPGLPEAIRAFGPDALLVQGWNFNSHLKCMRHFHGRIPVLFRGDSTLKDEQPGIKKWMRRLALTWVFRNVDIAFYVGRANREYFLKHGLTRAHLVFTPHAIDNERFACTLQQQQKAKELRTKLGIGQNDLLFLFAGKFEPKKSPALLLQAFLQSALQDAQLLMVGNGELEHSLKEMAGTNAFIHFLDFQNQQQMPAVYAMADIVVLPSGGPGETWGLAINEAMAAGKAVLVSDACGCAEDLVSEQNGWVFRRNQPADLEAKLSLIASARARLAVMGEHGRKTIEGYSFTHIAEAIEATVKNTRNIR